MAAGSRVGGAKAKAAMPWRANSSPSASRHPRASATPRRFRCASCPLSLAFTGPSRPVTRSISRAVGGGVGHLAVQMAARALEAGRVISSGSTPQSIALARQSGAHHVFDYKRDDVAAEIAELTGGRGVDLVFDATYSEAGFVETAKTVRQGGRWIGLGAGPGKVPPLGGRA